MRQLFILMLCLTLTGLTTFSQTIDFKLLIGTWHCYKRVPSADSVDDAYMTFKTDSTYIEERRYYENTTKGKYTLDRKNKKISYKNLISTTKFTKGKVKLPDQIMDVGLQDSYIVLLDKDNLIFLLRKQDEGELQSDQKVYFKRVK